MITKIINVIEVVQPYDITVYSFPISDNLNIEKQEEIVDKAEKVFKKIALENGAREGDISNYMDDVVYDHSDQEYKLYLV